MRFKLPPNLLTTLGVLAACIFGLAVLFLPQLWLIYNVLLAGGIIGVLIIVVILKIRNFLSRRFFPNTLVDKAE